MFTTNFNILDNNKSLNIVIQGYPGSFHAEAAYQFWKNRTICLVPADSFDQLADNLSANKADVGIMAIENSIAGTILQNYRILREHGFWVSGEIYLRIQHHLMGVRGAALHQIQEVASHPMAINQCRKFLGLYPQWKLVESEDTALSAAHVAERKNSALACIAAENAAQIYGLDIIASGIETNECNYTRFFIVQKKRMLPDSDADKASVYIRIPDKKGQLLKVLQVIQQHDLNMSKLQSFPVSGSFREYFFHLDIEFDHITQYHGLKEDLLGLTFEFEELGVYKRADMSVIVPTPTYQNILT